MTDSAKLKYTAGPAIVDALVQFLNDYLDGKATPEKAEGVLGLIQKEDKEQGAEPASEYRRLAIEAQKEGELEVDANALVSCGGEAGAYVQAWMWVEGEEEEE